MELYLPIIIQSIVTLLGIMAYVLLVNKIKAEHIQNPPYLKYFIICALYLGSLLSILTTLLWGLSFMGLLRTAFLIFIGPFFAAFIGAVSYKKRNLSVYHNFLFKLARNYILITIFYIACSLIISFLKN